MARSYLLLEPDIAWEADPLRENPDDRARLFDRYRELLQAGVFPFEQIGGIGQVRLERALAAAGRLLG